MSKTLFSCYLLINAVIHLQAQSPIAENSLIGNLKIGLVIQKTQSLYIENGFSINLSSPKVLENRISIGLRFITSKLGSAFRTNAIKQDHLLLNIGYHFRSRKRLQAFSRLNVGYFHANYEYAIFETLPNSSLLCSLDAGISYVFKAPISINLSTGYNFITGSGSKRPGTLYPLYYQISIYYTLINKD